ncbi:MAG: hypothetical protein OK454_07835, partial [Thaumarchaeota archaeon]|nr:hypothetical protein [Nitrososphaerota archaeon]
MPDSISPPSLDEPIFECATVVVVRGFIAGASIDIFVTGPTDVRIGGGVSDSAIGQVFLVDSAKVTFGATIYATQTFEGTKSHPSLLASV